MKPETLILIGMHCLMLALSSPLWGPALFSEEPWRGIVGAIGILSIGQLIVGFEESKDYRRRM